MDMILRFVFCIASGLVCHRVFYAPSLPLGLRWGSRFRYAVGVFGALPGAILLHDKIEVDTHARLAAAYLLAFLGFGTGTFLGHWIDYIREQRQ